MSLRRTATRLAHQFVSLLSYLREQLDLLRDYWRDYRAAKTRSAVEARSTAIHEAGHTVALIALGLAFSAVSIIPDIPGGTLGQVYVARDHHTADLPALPREAVHLRYAMVYYAGAEAVRQLMPTHPNPDAGASADMRDAAGLIRERIGGDAARVDLLFSLAKRRCAVLVDHYQPEIQELADELEAKLFLSARAAHKVFMTSLTRRAGRILTFASDPTLTGLAGDEVFCAFLRRLNLRVRPN